MVRSVWPMMGGNVMLQVENLSFQYDQTMILEDLSLTITRQEIVALAGPNGSGKTTLIKNIMNLLENQSGQILINHQQHTDARVQKEIMYLPSEDYLPEFLTGKEYLTLLCQLYQTSLNQKLLDKLLRYYAMTDSLSQLIENYSHGTKKKIQLISAFLIQPPLLIIDETLNGMDIEAREITKTLFHHYVQKDKAILLCTHDFSLVAALNARALLIHEGKIYYDSDQHAGEKATLDTIFYQMTAQGDCVYDLA